MCAVLVRESEQHGPQSVTLRLMSVLKAEGNRSQMPRACPILTRQRGGGGFTPNISGLPGGSCQEGDLVRCTKEGWDPAVCHTQTDIPGASRL